LDRLLTSRRGRPSIVPRTMLGQFVKNRRKKLGLSVAELAERARLTEAAIYKIECGERTNLQPSTLIGLSEALEVPMERLLKAIADTYRATPQEVPA